MNPTIPNNDIPPVVTRSRRFYGPPDPPIVEPVYGQAYRRYVRYRRAVPKSRFSNKKIAFRLTIFLLVVGSIVYSGWHLIVLPNLSLIGKIYAIVFTVAVAISAFGGTITTLKTIKTLLMGNKR